MMIIVTKSCIIVGWKTIVYIDLERIESNDDDTVFVFGNEKCINSAGGTAEGQGDSGGG